MVKKVIQQCHSPFDARSVLPVREHDKMARTPLMAFFNIPHENLGRSRSSGVRKAKKDHRHLEFHLIFWIMIVFSEYYKIIFLTKEGPMEAVIGGVVVGAVVAVAVPSIASGIGSGLRTVTKEIIKGGIVAYTAVSGMVAETGEQFNDMVAEAKAEIEHPDKKMPRAKPQHT
jgi:hypothetical protein